jgi:hypothetical protein
MSRHVAAWLAWSLCALSSALTALSVVLLVLNYSQQNTPIYDFWLENTVFPISISVMGAIIASRLPANPVGWLFCVAALICAIAPCHLKPIYGDFEGTAPPIARCIWNPCHYGSSSQATPSESASNP